MSKPVKVFVSQPMNGKTDEEIQTERRKILAAMTAEFNEIEEVQSYFDDFNDPSKNENIKHKPVAYLGASISKLAEADVAVFASGWESARGCKIEHTIATAYGINIYEL